jgi:L-rhamnose mutarotase
MHIPPENIAEYKKRHDEIWPELSQALKEAGISNYSIYFDEITGDLFAVLELAENHQMEALANMEIMKKWWAWNQPIQTYEGERPFTRTLKEVFHLK